MKTRGTMWSQGDLPRDPVAGALHHGELSQTRHKSDFSRGHPRPLGLHCLQHHGGSEGLLGSRHHYKLFWARVRQTVGKAEGPGEDQGNVKVKSLRGVYKKSLDKLAFYKAARVFDPRQLPALSHSITDFNAIPGFKNPSQDLRDEFAIYAQYKQEDIPDPLDLSAFWGGLQQRFQGLAAVAQDAIWMPVATVGPSPSTSTS